MPKLLIGRPLRQIFVFIVLGFICITLTDCATRPAPKALEIKIADMKMVAKCSYAGFVQGSSGWGNPAETVGIQAAKDQALDMAEKLSATHVVWTHLMGGHSPYVEGRAYFCE